MSHDRKSARKTTAASRARRRTDRARRQRIQGPRQGRDRRPLPELRHRLRRLEGEGAADRRQRAYALFHRPPAPPARSRRARLRRCTERQGADDISQASRRFIGFPERRRRRRRLLSASGVDEHAADHRAADDLRQRADAGDHRHVARPAFHGAVHQARRRAAPHQGADLAASRRRDQRARRRAARHRHHPRLRRA